jgi:hypothetical protein
MTNNFREKANFIWQAADDILRGAFKAHEYGDVIRKLSKAKVRLSDVLSFAKKANSI